MRPLVPAVSLVLACAGCVAEPEPEPLFNGVTSEVAPDDPNCRNYRAQVTVEGQAQPIVGRACQGKDGTWRVSEGPDGAPPQMIALYVPPPHDYDPWLLEFPIGFSLGTSVVFVDRQHHMHHVMAARGLQRIHIANGTGHHPARAHPAPIHPAAGGMRHG